MEMPESLQKKWLQVESLMQFVQKREMNAMNISFQWMIRKRCF